MISNLKRSAVALLVCAIMLACSMTAYAGSYDHFTPLPEDSGVITFDNPNNESCTAYITPSNPSSDHSGSATTQSNSAVEIPTDLYDYAHRVFELVNLEREYAGVNPVEWDIDFATCAAIRAEELGLKYSHERPDASTEGWPTNANGIGVYNAPSIADELGIEHRWIYENIVAQRLTPEDAVKAWMDSPGHRDVLLRESHTRCGVGVYYTVERAPSGYNWYWAIWFDNN